MGSHRTLRVMEGNTMSGIWTLLALLICGYSSAISSAGTPTFEITKATSRDAIPEVKVNFANGVEDTLVLEPYSSHGCAFIGHLADHRISSAAVTGCLDKPGDKMDITLLSDHNTMSHMFQVDFFGKVDVVENPFKHADSMRSLSPPGPPEALKELDEILDDGEEKLEIELAKAKAAVSFPRKVTAHIKFGYERTMKNRMAKDGTTFDKWITNTMTHVQSYYKHPSLPTQIHFKYDLGKTLYTNAYWTTDNLDDAAAVGERDNDPAVDMYVFWGDDPEDYGTIGLAWVGTACETYYKTSFNEHRDTVAGAAYVQAHEMGHNLGMSHDFDEKHGGTGKPGTSNNYCNNKGLMSYGRGTPTKWSSCSVSDFTYYWQLRDWGNTCFDKLSGGGGSSGNSGGGSGCRDNKPDVCKEFQEKNSYRRWKNNICINSYFAKNCAKSCQKC